MSDALEKAEVAAREAAVNTAAVQIALAAVELAKAAQQQAQQRSPQDPCQHDHKQGRSTGEWIGIGCAVCVGSVGLAFASIALAILGGVAAIVVLVLRDMWQSSQKGGRS